MNIESNTLAMHGETGQIITKEYLRPGVNFPSNLFNKVVPKTVNFPPPNINGNKYDRVKRTIRDNSKKQMTGDGST